MNGKQKCRILKDIRRQIAQANDIDLVIAECTHKGDCRGTCPRCESEVRYLERELENRRRLQKQVALAGISVGVTLALSGCSLIEQVFGGPSTPEELSGMVPYDVTIENTENPEPTDEPFDLDGDVALVDEIDVEDGEVPLETEDR